MGHIGMLPQSIREEGGYQAKKSGLLFLATSLRTGIVWFFVQRNEMALMDQIAVKRNIIVLVIALLFR
jgi:hypothetical protein